ncbi:DUF982 domain-containing protein [Mesorhizobium sp. B1-1-8]|uniref:DUF982 domain-containing protein n=1 Tax=Mesorhizobium sp. B1-1-8 TaxID=2589976 RepID=UPI001129914A|nr:DUF982 domain-containing protein [Mesorhizobium sp. B1-1-8]UCI06413.1 DUF982 domain-containing protein [Mesorhizobium sp. B1-1-8]
MNEILLRSDVPLRAPVAIAVGAGFKREIASLTAMQNFLKEWAAGNAREKRRAAMRACEAARAGQMELDEARQAFLGFAEKAGILWTGVDPVAALREAKISRARVRRDSQAHPQRKAPRFGRR